MKQLIDQELVDEYWRKGYITVKSLLNPKEIEVLNQATVDVLQMDGPQVMRERNGAPHVIYGMHLLDEAAGCAGQAPKTRGHRRGIAGQVNLCPPIACQCQADRRCDCELAPGFRYLPPCRWRTQA